MHEAQEKMMLLETTLCENYLHQCYDAQKCKKCNSVLYRELNQDRRARIQFKSVCSICTHDKEWQTSTLYDRCVATTTNIAEMQTLTDPIIEEKDKIKETEKINTQNNSVLKNELSFDHIFCWCCGNAWEDLSSSFCGYERCPTRTREDIINILTTCPTKKIGSVVEVPEIRGCPTCGQMVNHIDACKHMACRCGAAFCFVCMKPQLKSGNYQCGGSSDVCPVYKRQTDEDLPTGNRSIVNLFSLATHT